MDAAGPWIRSPGSKRLCRSKPIDASPPDSTALSAGTTQPDDPWAGLVQPHWGGNWTAHLGGHWWKGAGEIGTTGTTVAAAAAAAVAAAMAEATPAAPAQVGDDPWEPHPWAARVQPAWGGSWA